MFIAIKHKLFWNKKVMVLELMEKSPFVWEAQKKCCSRINMCSIWYMIIIWHQARQLFISRYIHHTRKDLHCLYDTVIKNDIFSRGGSELNLGHCYGISLHTWDTWDTWDTHTHTHTLPAELPGRHRKIISLKIILWGALVVQLVEWTPHIQRLCPRCSLSRLDSTLWPFTASPLPPFPVLSSFVLSKMSKKNTLYYMIHDVIAVID